MVSLNYVLLITCFAAFIPSAFTHPFYKRYGNDPGQLYAQNQPKLNNPYLNRIRNQNIYGGQRFNLSGNRYPDNQLPAGRFGRSQVSGLNRFSSNYGLVPYRTSDYIRAANNINHDNYHNVIKPRGVGFLRLGSRLLTQPIASLLRPVNADHVPGAIVDGIIDAGVAVTDAVVQAKYDAINRHADKVRAVEDDIEDAIEPLENKAFVDEDSQSQGRLQHSGKSMRPKHKSSRSEKSERSKRLDPRSSKAKKSGRSNRSESKSSKRSRRSKRKDSGSQSFDSRESRRHHKKRDSKKNRSSKLIEY